MDGETMRRIYADMERIARIPARDIEEMDYRIRTIAEAIMRIIDEITLSEDRLEAEIESIRTDLNAVKRYLYEGMMY